MHDTTKIALSIMEKVRKEIHSMEYSPDDEEVKIIIEHLVLVDSELQSLHFKKKIRLINEIFYAIRKDLGVIDPYVSDEKVSEIMVNGKDEIFIEKEGKTEKLETRFHSTEELEEVIRRIGAKVHREINELNPILDARLPNGSRINAVHKNVALGGPVLTIRKFPQKAIDMNKLIEWGTITTEAASFLEKLVKGGYNIFISGGTSSGKTTFLNVLSSYIPADERIIVIEDSAELQIHDIRNLIRLECRNANAQGKGLIEMRQLIKTSLRMRPDRIIVGEVRGEEVMDMIQAMNTGHDGSLSTGHGNSPEGMIHRLEAMFLQAADYPIDAIRSQISEGIDIMVHLGKTADNLRVVREIAEVNGVEENRIVLNKLFKYDINKGLTRTGNHLMQTEKLQIRGLSL